MRALISSLIIFLLLFCSVDSSAQKTELVDPNKKIQVNSLVDTPYKLAAHYAPVLLIRCLTNSEFPMSSKRKAHYERSIYLRGKDAGSEESSGDLLLERMYLDISAKKSGLFGRDVFVTGKLNNLDIDYRNIMRFSVTKKGNMQIKSTIAGEPLIDLDIVSNGNKKTNDAAGTLFGRKIKYHTYWRTTEGKLGAFDYKIYVEGIRDKERIAALQAKRLAKYKAENIKPVKAKDGFFVSSEGKIANYDINGLGELVACSPAEKNTDCYIMDENYGPLLIKSTLKVF